MLEKTNQNIVKMSHIWIEIAGKIKIAESYNHEHYHSDIWGDDAYQNPVRGYYSEDLGLITCHSNKGISKAMLNKIEKKFDKEGLLAIYFNGILEELCHA